MYTNANGSVRPGAVVNSAISDQPLSEPSPTEYK